MKDAAPAPDLAAEGDVNLSPLRAAWEREHVRGATRALLDRDADVYLHQSLSTPCFDALVASDGIWLTDVDGRQVVWDSPDDSWYRIERLEQLGNGEVAAEICHYGDRIQVDQTTGAIVVRQQVAARFEVTFTNIDGTWKWIHRQKLDSGGDMASDCAVPQP